MLGPATPPQPRVPEWPERPRGVRAGARRPSPEHRGDPRKCRCLCTRAPRCMRDVLAAAYFNSSLVERVHLYGQETHWQKKRGRALQPETLSIRSYMKMVQADHKRRRLAVQRQVIGGPQALHSWSRVATSYSTRRSSRVAKPTVKRRTKVFFVVGCCPRGADVCSFGQHRVPPGLICPPGPRGAGGPGARGARGGGEPPPRTHVNRGPRGRGPGGRGPRGNSLAQAVARRMMGKLKPRKYSALDMYIQEKYDRSLSAPAKPPLD